MHTTPEQALMTLASLSSPRRRLPEWAAAYAGNRKIDPEVLLNYRLAPDMFPFVRQIQIAVDLAKGAAARLAGVEVPKHDDTEKTFADLKARITNRRRSCNLSNPVTLTALRVGTSP